MGERMYTLRVSQRQMCVISRACEVLARLGIGQFREGLDELPLKEMIDHDDLLAISNILKRYMEVDGWRSNHCIHSHKVGDQAKIAFDLYQVIRHRLAWDNAVEKGIVVSTESPRKWPEMMQVFYDEPMKIAEEKLPEIL